MQARDLADERRGIEPTMNGFVPTSRTVMLTERFSPSGLRMPYVLTNRAIGISGDRTL
jgi:hypothetical protein